MTSPYDLFKEKQIDETTPAILDYGSFQIHIKHGGASNKPFVNAAQFKLKQFERRDQLQEKGSLSDDALKDLLLFGYQRGLHIDVEEVHGEPTEYTEQCVVTLIGRDITPSQLMLATQAISNNEGNIDRIIRLSRYPVMSYELAVNGGKLDEIKQGLLQVASETPELDIAVQPLNLSRKAKRLVVLDVDSTLIQNEVIDLLAEQAGCGAEVSRITELAMRGEIDFEESLLQRVSLLEGLDELGIERAWQNLS